MPGFRALFLEEPRILNRNTGLACQHSQQFEVAFIKCLVLVGEHRHRANRPVVGHQRNAAEAALAAERFNTKLSRFFDEIVADQNWLPRANHIFGQEISRCTCAPWDSSAIDDFQIEMHFVADSIERRDVKIFHVEQSPQLLPDLAKQILFM